MIEGRRIGVAFDMGQNRYRIVSMTMTTPATVLHTLYTIYLPRGVRLYGVTGPQLTFLPRGTASGGFRITLRAGNYFQQLTATVSGGRIRVFDTTTAPQTGAY